MGLSIGSGFSISSGVLFTPPIVDSGPTFNPTLLYTLNDPNAYGTVVSDNIGYSVDISDNYAIVGAYNEDDAGGLGSGKVYIYDLSTGSLIYTLNNPNAYDTSANDNFGWTVRVSGNYAIVGATAEDDASGTTSGKVYIYNLSTGSLVYTLNNPNPYGTSATDQFGLSIDILGNYAVVASPYEDESVSLQQSGKIYIYSLVDGSLVRTINNPNPYSTSNNDQFGGVRTGIAMNSTYVIVGAANEGDAGGTLSGKAYIYNLSTGALVYTLNNPNAYSTSAADQFGYSVAISDNYAIVSAQSEDDAGGSGSGKAYIFSLADGSLVHTLDNPNAYSTSNLDQFGFCVSMTDSYAIVGTPTEDDAGGTSSGKVYVFDVATGSLLHTFDNPNPYSTSLSDQFGWSAAISGNYVIVGAYGEDEAAGTNSGKVYIYQLMI